MATQTVQMFRRAALAIAAAVVLNACSASGAGGPTVAPPLPQSGTSASAHGPAGRAGPGTAETQPTTSTGQGPAGTSSRPPQSSVPMAPLATSSTRVDLANVNAHDPAETAAAFVTLYAQRSSADSQAGNFALRSARFATPRLQQQMAAQVQADPAAIPQVGASTVIITGVTKLPDVSVADRVGFRVVYTARRTEQKKTVGELTEVALNTVLDRQADGSWLVDSVSFGAN